MQLKPNQVPHFLTGFATFCVILGDALGIKVSADPAVQHVVEAVLAAVSTYLHTR
jgi:hypothetical protein